MTTYKVAADLKTRQGLKRIYLENQLHTKKGCSGLENPTGIETYGSSLISLSAGCCSGLENPTGIETALSSFVRTSGLCCSGLENPTGIETGPWKG